MTATAWAMGEMMVRGERVELRSLVRGEVSEVAAAIVDPTGWHGRHWAVESEADIERMLLAHLAEREKGAVHPLVYRTAGTGEVCGITRLMRVEPANRCLEIGGTWVAPKWRRTFVNTEVKLALLGHCFEALACLRVELRVHEGNLRSQAAVARIGAKLEGAMRCRQIDARGGIGGVRLYSVVAPEWAETKAHLTALARRA